jgi:EmrB/QacA subfamily drug resistance transporter
MSTPTAALDPPGSTVVADPRRRRLILVSMCLALVAVVASVSGLNVAQPMLAEELGASQSQLLWVINGYTVALAALLLPIGAIGDRWGRKPVLMLGLAVFIGASLASALASDPTMLIATRVIAGVGAAMIMPVTLSVITSSFPAEARAQAVGVWAGFAGAGGILGLVTSAAIVDNVTWPWVFAAPIAAAVAALAVTAIVVPNSREHDSERFDALGSILSALAVGGVVLGIHEGPEQGWTSPLTLVALVIGVVAAVTFVVWELRHPKPLLDVRVFRDRTLGTGSLGLVAIFAVMFGLFLVVIQYLQVVLGWSALRSAVGLLPIAVVMMPLSAVAPRISQRVGYRNTLAAGALLTAAGLATMALMADNGATYGNIVPGLLVVAIGVGLAMSPSTTAITESLPADKQGVASALNDTVRELGSALGIALIGSVLQAGYSSNVAGATGDLPPDVAHQVEEGIGSAAKVAPELGDQAVPVLTAAKDAFVDGWIGAMWVSVVIAAAAGVFVLARGPRKGDETGYAAATGEPRPVHAPELVPELAAVSAGE